MEKNLGGVLGVVDGERESTYPEEERSEVTSPAAPAVAEATGTSRSLVGDAVTVRTVGVGEKVEERVGSCSLIDGVSIR